MDLMKKWWRDQGIPNGVMVFTEIFWILGCVVFALVFLDDIHIPEFLSWLQTLFAGAIALPAFFYFIKKLRRQTLIADEYSNAVYLIDIRKTKIKKLHKIIKNIKGLTDDDKFNSFVKRFKDDLIIGLDLENNISEDSITTNIEILKVCLTKSRERLENVIRELDKAKGINDLPRISSLLEAEGNQLKIDRLAIILERKSKTEARE